MERNAKLAHLSPSIWLSPSFFLWCIAQWLKDVLKAKCKDQNEYVSGEHSMIFQWHFKVQILKFKGQHCDWYKIAPYSDNNLSRILSSLEPLEPDSPSQERSSNASRSSATITSNTEEEAQYIREFVQWQGVCDNCRGRGCSPCTECEIDRLRSDCNFCDGKAPPKQSEALL
ncbi:hypothetical protein FCM35_KLT09601 [Carex littledalei]|uniref:Uncharacterized protein n=1 Tax=Carex littledalei TaxID=544730 RepID=A0A833RH08_9POAL|nr:hypothetical protein FCM35_KLT09601 [Carex littledalei]